MRKYTSFHPGQKCLDTNGKPIQAHGFSVFYNEKEKNITGMERTKKRQGSVLKIINCEDYCLSGTVQG